jgi:hypothetical protein
MAAVGRPGRADDLPMKLQEREIPSDRRPVVKTVCTGPFQFD